MHEKGLINLMTPPFLKLSHREETDLADDCSFKYSEYL